MPLNELKKVIDEGYPNRMESVWIAEMQHQRELHRLEARAIYDGHDSDEPFKASDQRRVNVASTAISMIDMALQSQNPYERRREEDAAVRRAHPHVFGSSLGVYEREDREAGMLRSFLDGTGPNRLMIPVASAMREREAIRAGRDPLEVRNALLWDTGSIASGVPTLMASSIYEVLEANISMLRMPTTKLTTTTGNNLDIPKLTTHQIGTQVIAQGTAIGGTDPTFDKLTLGAFKYGALLQVASETITDTGFDILGLVARDCGRALGRLIDTDLVVGTGSGEPNGVMTAIGGAGTIATGGSLVDPTFEKLIDLQYSVNDAYRNSGNAAWLMRDATAGVLRKLRDGNGGTVGAPLWQTSTTSGIAGVRQPSNLLGDPAFTDPAVASLASNAKIIAYGDFSAYYVRLVGDLIFERDDSFAFDKDLSTFRAKWRVDGDVIDTAAINIMKRNVA